MTNSSYFALPLFGQLTKMSKYSFTYIYVVYNYVGLWGKAVFLSLSYQHYEGASHPEVSSLVICNKSSLMHWHQQ